VTSAAGARRYALVARVYDLVSGEQPVYRAGRLAAIERLGLRPGDQVLDIGCGTGLNFPLLLDRVGPAGRVVGLDASVQMLAQARRRALSRGWTNVHLLCADASAVDPADLSHAFSGVAADAVLSTYTLSLIDDWPKAWARAMEAARPGARIAVVDMQMPTGTAALLWPLARLACALGGADPRAHPWTALERDCEEVVAVSLRGGHLQVRAGTRPGNAVPSAGGAL
jgi:S-adenosylmethionine-diacylgycerolhomoserine-N-methlytransferase